VKWWFLADTARLGEEKAAVDALEGSWFSLQRWTIAEGRFAAEGIIKAHGAKYPVRLVYPDQFPQVPAWVEPQDPTAKWSGHQYGAGGVLCLELRPDTWLETASGADVLRSARNLLQTENPLGDQGGRERAPSGHQVGAIQAYDWFANPFFISADCEKRLRAGVAENVNVVCSALSDGVLPAFVRDSVERAEHDGPPTDFVDLPTFTSAAPLPAVTPKNRNELSAAAQFDAPTREQLAATPFALVLFVGESKVSAFQVIADNISRREIVVLPANLGQRSGRAPVAAPKRVAIVGAGSVGSKVAEILIRSGIRRLTLIDGDIMLPGNLERHVLDWRGVGFRKVSALKRRLLAIVPGAEIEEVADNLNWQRSARTHSWQVDKLAKCDVILDATGDVPTALFLGAVAAANKRPFVSVEVFEGGIGALIASCLPERDVAFATARGAFLGWCDAQGVPAPTRQGRPYESIVEDGAVVADDAAVTMAAGHASRIILDILDGNPAPPEAAWLLIGFRKAWNFDGHGHTIRLSVGAASERDKDVDLDALAFAVTVMKETLGESPPSE